MSQLKLVHKLLGMSALAVFVLALVSYVSHESLKRADASARLVAANGVQRAQMDADMMHDAIRADVMMIVTAIGANQVETANETRARIDEHSQRYRDDVKKVGASEEPEVVAALADTQSFAEAYLREAQAYKEASRNVKAAPPTQSFERAFEALEEKMEKLGDSIDTATHRIADEAGNERARAARTNLTVSLVCGALLIVMSLLLVRSIQKPLGAMARAAREVAEGNVDQSIDYRSADEVGELADALRMMIDYIQGVARAAVAIGQGDLSVTIRPRSDGDSLSRSFLDVKHSLERLVHGSNVLIQAAQRGELATRADVEGLSGAFRAMIEGENAVLAAVGAPIREAKEVLARVEARDLTARMRGEYSGDYAAIKVSLNSAVKTLEQALSEVAETADQVASAAEQITEGSANLAQRSAAQLVTIERIGRALEETTKKAKENASSAHSSRAHAEEAVGTAGRGSESMTRLSEAVEAMKSAADETAKIVRTIDEIAFQTNLLALNAAVEAARAGEEGRGFAVVADEVRTLAVRSAEAARNSTQVIERSLRKAEEGVAINRDAAVAFHAIAEQVQKVVAVTVRIAESSREQHTGVASVSSSAESIRSDAENGAATAEETASAAAELAEQAASMRRMTAQFNLGNGRSKPASAYEATPLNGRSKRSERAA